jgi:flagellum-specific peptidoglycan hydrolase FlgJ
MLLVLWFPQSNCKQEVYTLIDASQLEYKTIVKQQFVLETGHGKSKLCTQCNNMFGLVYSNKLAIKYKVIRCSSNKKYCKFVSKEQCLLVYTNSVYKKIMTLYKPRSQCDYYNALVKIKYATNPNYIKDLKKMKL